MFKTVGILLFSLFIYSQVYNTSVWVNYEMNIDEITDMFCENVDKPELNCNGTCHLKKQLIQTDNSIPVESEHSLYINEIQLFSAREFTKITVPQKSITSHHTFFEESYSFLQGLDIFHPPKA